MNPSTLPTIAPIASLHNPVPCIVRVAVKVVDPVADLVDVGDKNEGNERFDVFSR